MISLPVEMTGVERECHGWLLDDNNILLLGQTLDQSSQVFSFYFQLFV